jgi:hypothetical protein
MREHYGDYEVWKLWETEKHGQIFCAAKTKKDLDKFVRTLDEMPDEACVYKNFVDNKRDIHFNDIVL